MEVLKNIRLEHDHQALKDSKIRQQLNLNSVEEIRKHYGFQSRGNFAAIYADYFGEKPYATMKGTSKTSASQLNSRENKKQQIVQWFTEYLAERINDLIEESHRAHKTVLAAQKSGETPSEQSGCAVPDNPGNHGKGNWK